MHNFEETKKSALLQSLAIDAISMASYAVPWLGEGTDVIVAPLLAFWIWRLHGSWTATTIGFFEELLPFTDIVPTAILTWWYRFVLREKETRQQHGVASQLDDASEIPDDFVKNR